MAFLLSAYDEEEVKGENRVVLRLHHRLAPYKVAVLPLSRKDELTGPAREVFAVLAPEFMCDYDETQSIGRRYRRQDELGTPYAVTFDFDSLEDQAVTVRERRLDGAGAAPRRRARRVPARADDLMADDAEYLRLNRLWWDERVAIHAEGEFYDLDGFVAGRDTLLPFEPEVVGPVDGLDLVHLQCHMGMDTLSWARRGARVTGLDFSTPAVDTARGLADRIGVDARFVVADVYDAVEVLGTDFDLTYQSLGSLNWHPDMDRWAAVLAALVRPVVATSCSRPTPWVGSSTTTGSGSRTGTSSIPGGSAGSTTAARTPTSRPRRSTTRPSSSPMR